MCFVDLPTGRVSLKATDFEIPGLIPIGMKRHYRSTNIWLGDLGHGWGHPFGAVLYSEGGGLILRGADGRRVPFPRPEFQNPSAQPSEQSCLYFVPAEHLPSAALRSRMRSGGYAYQRGTDCTLFFDAGSREKVLPWKGIADRFGNIATVDPDAGGLPARIDYPEGRTLIFERNKSGLITEIRIAETSKPSSSLLLVRYLFDQKQDLVAAQDPAGTRVYRYEDHRLVLHQDRCGMAIEAAYDSEGRCVRTSSPNRVTERTNIYEPEKKTTSVRDSLGNISVIKHSDEKAVIETIDAAGGVSKFDYDGQGRLVQLTNQMGFATSILYGLAGGQVGKVNPCGAITVFEGDAHSDLISVTTAAGAVFDYKRDELGRVIEMTRPGFGSYEIGYDEQGRMSRMKLPGGRVATFRWSPEGRSLVESDEEGLLSEQKFDLLGRLVERHDARGGTSSYRYSEAGYLAEVVNSDGSARRLSYDAEGRLVEVRSATGRVARWKYDEAGRCVEVTLPTGETIRSEHDTENRLTAIQSADGLWHRYAYDKRGLVIRQEFSDGRIEQYDYDPRGALTRFIDPAGGEIHAESDEAARVKKIHYPDGTEKMFDYDPAGQWMRVEWDGHLLERDVTPEGFAPLETQDEYTLHRTYNDSGRLLSVIDSLGRKVTYSYDECDRVIEIQVTAGVWKRVDDQQEWTATGAPRSHHFKYDRADNIVEWESAPGKTEVRHYDAMNRMTGQTIRLHGALIVSREYAYNEEGRVRSLFDSRRGARQFTYDEVGRLIQVKEGGRVIRAFTYNREGDLEDDGRQYARAHRVRRIGGITLEYDLHGFVVKRRDPYTTDTFEYSTHGLLKVAQIGTKPRIRYEYDGFSRLVRKHAGTSASRFFWNGDQMWAMRDAAGRFREWLFLPGSFVPLEQTDEAGACSVHADHLGTVLELVDENGVVVWSNPSGIWGEGRPTGQASDPQTSCPFGFPGQIWDPDIGLYYNRFRHYYPETGHYLTPDPVGIWGGFDAYTYVPDPVNTADPLGLKCEGKENEPTLYRGDKRPPDEVCKQGFVQRDPSAGLSLLQHSNGVPPTGSNWISTTHDGKIAEDSFGPIVYVIDNPGCGKEVDCDPEVQAWEKSIGGNVGSEKEIAFDKPIPPKNVVGWYPAGNPTAFTPC